MTDPHDPLETDTIDLSTGTPHEPSVDADDAAERDADVDPDVDAAVDASAGPEVEADALPDAVDLDADVDEFVAEYVPPSNADAFNDAEPSAFFEAGVDLHALDDLNLTDRISVLERLGPAHFRSKGFSFMGFLQTVYDHVADEVKPKASVETPEAAGMRSGDLPSVDEA